MKKTLKILFRSFVFLTTVSLVLVSQVDTCHAAAKQELVFLTWSEYIDPDIVKEFEKKYNAKIKEIYFETDEMRDEMMVTADGKGYDLVIANGPTISRYVKRKWLAPINKKQISNMKYIDIKWLKAFPDAEKYTTPYFWGTTGIAYRKDKVGKPVTSWNQLFKPGEDLRGKIVMIKDSRDLIGMALKALGYSANSTEKKELVAAEKLLMGQKPFVKTYSSLNLTKDSVLVTGEAWMAMAYNGDALMLKEFNEDIEFVVPQEGGNLWCDYLVIPESSSKKELAAKFINYLHGPKINARNAEFVYYATPNQAAERLLPKDFLEDPVSYPSKSVIEKSETHKALPARVQRNRNNIFSRVTK